MPGGLEPIVDAHQHFWDLERNYHPWLCDPEPIQFRYGDYSALRRTYLPPDYRADAQPYAIARSIHMEAEWNPADPIGETRWLEGVQAQWGLPDACVAAAWLHRDDAAAVLAAQAAHPIVRGVRHKPAAAPAPQQARRGLPGSLDDPRWRAGYALLANHGLSFDLQTPWWHLDAAADLAADFPDTALILNHTGLPADRSPEGLAAWRAALETLAQHANTYIKISGLGLPGRPWTLAGNGPIIRDAVAIFGAERSLFASNFPVDGLTATLPVIIAGVREALAHLPAAALRSVFHDTAVRVYRLEVL